MIRDEILTLFIFRELRKSRCFLYMGNGMNDLEPAGISDRPAVSVVLAVFNGARTIREAVESVLDQTFSDFELLIWNDGSTDQTATIVTRYSDPRVIILGGPENTGAGLARDAAINVARGKWIAFIDADDAWLPTRLERLMAAAGTRKDVMVFDDIMDCHDSSGGLVQWRRIRGRRAFGAVGGVPVDVGFQDYIRQRRLLIKPLFPAQVVFTAGLHHSSYRFGEDTEYFLRLIEQGLQLIYVPEALYLYRSTAGSLSANPRRNELMLEVLVQARERMVFDTPDDMMAMDDKITGVRREIRYAPFLQALKGQKWRAAIEMLREHPGLLAEFLVRMQEYVPYRLHRWLHQAWGR